ncbi:MAG: thioredoxin domain-containing protein [Planctomycetota bacterium]
MNKHIAIIAAVGILGLCRSSYGMATEQIGPDAAHPTVAQQDWPKGIVGIPRHMSRVYSIWVNGNENFYFKCKVDEINELLAIFAKARMRDHVVRIQPGVENVSTFGREEIEYNVQLQIVAGIVLSFAREKMRDDLPLEPRLTILTGDDNSLVNQLKWPENVIVESDIPGVSINADRTKPKRDVYYGLCEFADGSPPVEFVKGVNSRITLWEQDEPNGIGVGRIDNKGYLMVRLSDAELVDLKKGKTWLTMTIGNWLVKAARTDTRFPVDMLTKDKDKARPFKVAAPAYYYGRILFEDGSPPVLDPRPWPGAEIRVDIRYGGFTEIDPQGYFKVSLTKEHFDKLSSEKPRRNIYVPDMVRKGRARADHTFPANLLSPDRAKAGVVEIPRPKLPRKELATAESKVGKPIPGFDTVRFTAFQKDQIKGKPLLICFWDFDQRPSRQCIRVLEKQRQTWRAKNVVVLAVHAGTKQPKQVTDWLSKNGPSLTAATIQGDPYDTLFAWGARSSPWLVLTDEKHVITKAGFNIGDAELIGEKAK